MTQRLQAHRPIILRRSLTRRHIAHRLHEFLHNINRIHSSDERLDPQWSAIVLYLRTSGLTVGVVGFGAVSIDLEKSEYHHLATDKDGGDAVVDIIVGEARGWL